MENKVAAGSLLLHNISHGMMSNVESSLYLWDLSQCLNKVTKNVIINWTIHALLNKSNAIFKNHPIILVSMRNYKDYQPLMVNESTKVSVSS